MANTRRSFLAIACGFLPAWMVGKSKKKPMAVECDCCDNMSPSSISVTSVTDDEMPRPGLEAWLFNHGYCLEDARFFADKYHQSGLGAVLETVSGWGIEKGDGTIRSQYASDEDEWPLTRELRDELRVMIEHYMFGIPAYTPPPQAVCLPTIDGQKPWVKKIKEPPDGC